MKKRKKVNFLIVNQLIELEFLLHVWRLQSIDAVHFLSLCKATIIYFTMCQFTDFAKLIDQEF